MELQVSEDLAIHNPGTQQRPNVFNPSQPAEKIDLVDLFGKQFQGAVIELDFELSARTPRQLFQRDFVYVSRLFYNLDRYRDIKGVDQTLLDTEEEKVAKKLDAVKQLVTKNVRELDALLAANSHDNARVTNAKTVLYRAPIISPFAREYVEVLQKANGAFVQADVAFLFGLIDRKQKQHIDKTVRQAIRAISQVVRQARAAALAHLKALNGQAADEATRQVISQIASDEASTLLKEGEHDAELLGSITMERTINELAGSGQALPAPDEIQERQDPSPIDAQPVGA
jgi:hypothetical protein